MAKLEFKILIRLFALAMGLFFVISFTPKRNALEPNYGNAPAIVQPVVHFVVHPLHNPERLNEVFWPMVNYLNKNIPEVNFQLEASVNYAAFEEKLKKSVKMVKAYKQFIKNKYDLVLLDLQMPVLDGYQTIKLIRDWESANQKERTKVFALSADSMPDLIEKSLAAGCDHHISEPVRKDSLLKLLAEA